MKQTFLLAAAALISMMTWAQQVPIVMEIDGKKVTKKVELFTWEKLDYVGKVKKAFGLK